MTDPQGPTNITTITPILIDEWTVKLIGYVGVTDDVKEYQQIAITGLLQAVGGIEAKIAIRDSLDNATRGRRFMLVVEALNDEQDTNKDS